MYGYKWTDEYGIFELSVHSTTRKELRPVFKEELDFFGLNECWEYPETSAPLLWAENVRRYLFNGKCVAEAKGGGFYTKPTIEIYEKNLSLSEINIDALWKKNESTMKGLEQKAIVFIRETYEEFRKKGSVFVVAFSGGKDSLLLLDLVSKALPPDAFYVIFSNTGMELQSTLDAVEEARKLWSNLRFYEASSHLSPLETWHEFGPPGRRMRWCCAVHKSVPTILKLREITQRDDVYAVVFDGVRSEESLARSHYSKISVDVKNLFQTNCSPILKWSSSEVYLYLFKNKILLNKTYVHGFSRVGCKVCPMASLWWDGIANALYPTEMRDLLSAVEKYSEKIVDEKERRKFIEQGGWKGRIGGRGLPNGGNRVIETISRDTLIFRFTETKQAWRNVAPIAGAVVEDKGNQGIQLIHGRELAFTIDDAQELVVTYAPFSRMDRFILALLRGVAYKVAYCIGCKACMAQCPYGAFTIEEDGSIFIREDKCLHCGNCISFVNGKGCLVAKSLSTTEGGDAMNLKGMNRYQHFGFRKTWLEHYFEHKSRCFTLGQLGNRQYDALKIWLRESGLMNPPNKGENSGQPTPLCEKLEKLGAHSPLTWAVIWGNLAYNSVILRWYMLKVPPGDTYEKKDFVTMLGEEYSPSTRSNAVTSLMETLRYSPIGEELKQGIPIKKGNSYKFFKRGWEIPDAGVILYSLYLWAEATKRYSFALSQMEEARKNENFTGVDPVVMFGLPPGNLRGILQELAIQYKEYIRVSFVADLDNVRLSPEVSSLEVLDLLLP